MKRLTIIAFVAGLAVATALILRAGFGDVMTAAAGVGAGLIVVVLVRLAVTALAAAGWWLLLTPPGPALPGCILIKSIREAINNLLPVAQVGGEVVGGRLAAQYGASTSAAAAGIAADMLVQVATQFLFTLAGLVVLISYGGDQGIVRVAGWGLGLSVPLIVAFVLVQGRHGEAIIRRVFAFFVPDASAGSRVALDAVYAQLRTIYADRGKVAASSLVHLLGWLAGAFEIWVALWFMGIPAGFAEALVIESLGQAVRSAAFIVPGAIGVQEGGYIALCAVFGVPADRALALSLIKRAADLALGIPSLIAWQVLEGRRVLRQPAPDGRLP